MSATAIDAPAPGLAPDVAGQPWWRRAWAQGGAYLAPNLIFLSLPAWYARGTLSTARYAGLVVVIVLLAVALLGSTLAVEWRMPRRWAWTALVIGLVVAMGVVGGEPLAFAYFNAYIASTVVLLLPWRSAKWMLFATTAVGLGLAARQGDLMPGLLALMGLMIGYNVGRGFYEHAIEAELHEANERTAVLAVAAERERIGRDLHDILGHSLTTIVVKAYLAGRLLGRADDAARAEIDGVATVARQALADVRATASGMREVRLASELAAARAVLGSAGIAVESPSALPALDDADSELLGYVLREAVTNVLRHSGAQHCRIHVDEAMVEVADDGVGIAPGTPRSGLDGLAARLRDAGWALEVEGRDGVRVRAVREAT